MTLEEAEQALATGQAFLVALQPVIALSGSPGLAIAVQVGTALIQVAELVTPALAAGEDTVQLDVLLADIRSRNDALAAQVAAL